jgi:ADP-ribose pyrophosphatase
MSLSDRVKRVLTTNWFSVDSVSINDTDTEYYRINYPPGVVILPVLENGHFLLIRQCRPLLNRETLEIPSGAIEPGETPIEAAKRELEEETGYASSEVIEVGSGIIRIDREDTRNYFFVARDIYPLPQISKEAGIELVSVSPGDFKKLVIERRFDHVAALSVILFAAWHTEANARECVARLFSTE